MQRKYKRLPKQEVGQTPWFARHEKPVRPGEYECIAWFTSSAPSSIWRLTWDGKGFICPIPMVVDYWRGLTNAGYEGALKVANAGVKK